MSHAQYSPYHHQSMNNLPQLDTQNNQHQYQNKRPFPTPSYQQSPGAMSPTVGGIPPAKRQRLSPNPPSPYQSPFSASPYATPYATSPPGNQYLPLPQSPAAAQPSSSFHQPQAYQNPHETNSRPPQGSMPPPKVPYSKTQDNAELEKANPRDMDVNNISDVLTGSGIDLRAEEDNLLHNFGSRNYGNSFNSQASASTVSPHGSFNQWTQNSNGHGAFQGTGPMNHPVSQEQHEAELLRKHEQAARALAESTQQPLTDPFLFANQLRQRIARRAYEHGITVNLEGLFDKIPEYPQNVTRTAANGSNGEAVASLQADSLLNQNASFVEVLSLISLAAEERVRSVLEDSVAMMEIRQNTSHGVVPHDLADLAVANSEQKQVNAVPVNISKTAWEAPDSAISPMTVTVGKQPMNATRLPTPPTDTPPTPQPTIAFTDNHVAKNLKRRVADDEKFEEARMAKRQKRKQGSASTPAETPAATPIQVPEKLTKKERDRIAKAGQTDDVLHRKANETARMALGGKAKKYAWMAGGGGGGGSGASTPRINTAVGGAGGTGTPGQGPPVDQMLRARKRTYGEDIENNDIGKKVQLRDLISVLQDDGNERKTLAMILARLKNTDKDELKKDDRRTAMPPAR